MRGEWGAFVVMVVDIPRYIDRPTNLRFYQAERRRGGLFLATENRSKSKIEKGEREHQVAWAVVACQALSNSEILSSHLQTALRCKQHLGMKLASSRAQHTFNERDFALN